MTAHDGVTSDGRQATVIDTLSPPSPKKPHLSCGEGCASEDDVVAGLFICVHMLG